MARPEQREPRNHALRSTHLHSRRIVLKAAGMIGAMTMAGGLPPLLSQSRVRAQATSSTRSADWVEADEFMDVRAAASGDWITFQTDFPITGVGAHWDGEAGTWPVVQFRLSLDSVNFTETFTMVVDEDGGRPDRDGRIFTRLLCSGGAQFIKYRVLDQDGAPASVPGFTLTYIDASDGPSVADIPAVSAATEEAWTPPAIISREEWGADESLRFSGGLEVWPQVYATVEHAIIHHTETPNTQDPVQAIRSVYYYHAVTRGWGDIGYNYLVDRFGNIYEGRVGGQDVVAGHAWQFNTGSSGISILGDHRFVDISLGAQAAIVAITAWVARDLDPLGASDFWGIPALPTICGHRDVNDTNCPGDLAYDDLPEIRQLVAAALENVPTGPPGGLIIGDTVVVQTDDGGPLNLRATPGLAGTILGELENGELGLVVGGPEAIDAGNWYQLDTSAGTGWVTAEFLILAPPEISNGGRFTVGSTLAVNVDSASLYAQPRASAAVQFTIPFNFEVFVVNGPRFVDGFVWYEVVDAGDMQFGPWGWTNQDRYRLVSDVPPGPPPQVGVGDTIEVTSALNLRISPSTSGGIITVMAVGTQGLVLAGPTTANGYDWFQIQTAVGTGWAVSTYMRVIEDADPPPPEGEFSVGDTVVTVTGLNLRSTPSTSGSILVTMPTGTEGTVLAGPTAANGFDWYQLQTSIGTGWAAGEYLDLADPPDPPPGGEFDVGDTVETVVGLRLRSTPSTSGAIVATMPVGTVGSVLAGPTEANGYSWYQLNTTLGMGWAAGEYLDPSDQPPPPPPQTGIQVGDTIRVADGPLNLRSGPSTTNTILASLPTGTTGTVVGGPTAAGGITWYQISTASGTGWVAGQYIAEIDPPPTSGGIQVGDTVFVNTDALNLRSAASTGASVIAVMLTGTTGTVLAGPTASGGITWYQLQTPQGTGWAAGQYLAKA